jgi:hypothetical protein
MDPHPQGSRIGLERSPVGEPPAAHRLLGLKGPGLTFQGGDRVSEAVQWHLLIGPSRRSNPQMDIAMQHFMLQAHIRRIRRLLL